MMYRILGFVVLMFWVSPALAQTSAEIPSPNETVRWFADRLYALGETSGGSPEEWDDHESQAIAKLRQSADADPNLLIEPDEKGRTPLANAAFSGHAVLVEELLSYQQVRDTVELADSGGLRPVDHALLAFKQSFLACKPGIWDNAFAYIPIIVVQPYYDDRAPYPAILDMLVGHGSVPDTDRMRDFWTENCSGAQSQLGDVSDAHDLQMQLMALGKAAIVAKLGN